MIFLSDSIRDCCQCDCSCQISLPCLLRLETVSELAMVIVSPSVPEREIMYSIPSDWSADLNVGDLFPFPSRGPKCGY